MMNILLLTQENCHFCEMAKEMLDRLSTEYHFSITTLDLNSVEGQRLAEQGGILFPPGIFINGDPFSYGRPSERAFRKELGRQLSNASLSS